MATKAAPGRTIGVLFLTGTVAGAMSLGPLTPLLDAPDVLRAVGEEPSRAVLGAALILVMGLALAFIPLVAYPILQAESRPLALGYVVFRGALETGTYLASAVLLLVLVPLGRDHVAAGGATSSQVGAVGALVLGGYEVIAHVALTFVFSVGALLFSSLLFRARLVPRWIAGWGVVGALLLILAGVLAMTGVIEMGSPAQTAMNALQELTLAGWLIVRGFDPAPRAPSAAVTTRPTITEGSHA
jgi:hypothetical protein